VRGQARRERRLAGFAQPLVGECHRWREHTAAQVARADRLARRGGEHERLGACVPGVRLERSQLVVQGSRQAHVACACIGLGIGDPQPTGGQVNVAPAQREQLPEPQPGERERCQHRATVHVAMEGMADRCPGVQLASGVEQRADLRGRV
jgi:hypothetical protein